MRRQQVSLQPGTGAIDAPTMAGFSSEQSRDDRQSSSGGVLDNLGRDLARTFIQQDTDARNDLSSTVQEPGPSLLDAFGRDLFKHSSHAVENAENTAKKVLERTASPPRTSADTPDLEARCSWCSSSAVHKSAHDDPTARHVVALPVTRKTEYECSSCSRRTCPCDNYAAGCRAMAKRFPLWDDALCKECDERDRAEAQHVIGMMSQLVDGVKDRSGHVIGGVVGGVVDHSKGLVEHMSGETSKAVDHLGGETSRLVEHVKERSEEMADRSQFKGIVNKLNADFSKLGQQGKDLVEDVTVAGGRTPRDVGDGDSSGKYLQLMLGSFKDHSERVLKDVTKDMEEKLTDVTREIEGQSDKLTKEVGGHSEKLLQTINEQSGHLKQTYGWDGADDRAARGTCPPRRPPTSPAANGVPPSSTTIGLDAGGGLGESAELEKAMLAGLSDAGFEESLRHTMSTEGFVLPITERAGFPTEVSVDTNRPHAPESVDHDQCFPRDSHSQEMYNQIFLDWKDRAEAEMEPWEVVRDVLMTWPCSPTKEHVARCGHLLEQRVFVERWLRTSNRGGTGKVEEALRRLLKHVAWRYEYKVDGILDEDWAAYDARNEMFVSGLDRHLRPSVTWRVSRHDPQAVKGQTPATGARYLVCTIERARAVNPASRHIIFICDCSALQWKNFEHAMFVEAVGMLQENYPDNLAHCFLFPVGWLINSLLGVCRPLLDTDTANKMSVLTEEDVQKGLREHFDEDEIEVRLGGNLDVDTARTRRVHPSETGPALFMSRTKSWEDRDGCGVARVWLYKDMMELQRKFVPPAYHHLLADTPTKLAYRRAREVADKLSSAPSTPSVRTEHSFCESGDKLQWGGGAGGDRSPAAALSATSDVAPVHLDRSGPSELVSDSSCSSSTPQAVQHAQRCARGQMRLAAGGEASGEGETEGSDAASAGAERRGAARAWTPRNAAGCGSSESQAEAGAAIAADDSLVQPRLLERRRLGAQAPSASALPVGAGGACSAPELPFACLGASSAKDKMAEGGGAAAHSLPAVASWGGDEGSTGKPGQHAVAGASDWSAIRGWLLKTGAATGEAFFCKLMALSAYLVAAVWRWARGG